MFYSFDELRSNPNLYRKMFYTFEQLSFSPSFRDRLNPEIEYDFRILGCELIRTCSIMLKLSSRATSIGQIIFQKFYYAESFLRFSLSRIAMTCVQMASAMEGCAKSINEVHATFMVIGKQWNKNFINYSILPGMDQLAMDLRRDEYIVASNIQYLYFREFPEEIIETYLHKLGVNRVFKELARRYVLEALRTNIYLKFDPITVAYGCIWFVGNWLNMSLSEAHPWYKAFGIHIAVLQDITDSLLELLDNDKARTVKFFGIWEFSESIKYGHNTKLGMPASSLYSLERLSLLYLRAYAEVSPRSVPSSPRVNLFRSGSLGPVMQSFRSRRLFYVGSSSVLAEDLSSSSRRNPIQERTGMHSSHSRLPNVRSSSEEEEDSRSIGSPLRERRPAFPSYVSILAPLQLKRLEEEEEWSEEEEERLKEEEERLNEKEKRLKEKKRLRMFKSKLINQIKLIKYNKLKKFYKLIKCNEFYKLIFCNKSNKFWKLIKCSMVNKLCKTIKLPKIIELTMKDVNTLNKLKINKTNRINKLAKLKRLNKFQ